MSMMCPDCGASSYLMVDGERMSEETLLILPRPPKTIEKKMYHALWCPRDDNRLNAQKL